MSQLLLVQSVPLSATFVAISKRVSYFWCNQQIYHLPFVHPVNLAATFGAINKCCRLPVLQAVELGASESGSYLLLMQEINLSANCGASNDLGGCFW